MSEPRVRATYMKQFAARVELLGAAGEAVRAADPELFGEIDAASRLGWMPAEANVRMIDALVAALGAQRSHDFQADQLTSQFSTPLWRGFIEGGVRSLGLDPAVMTRWVPSAIGLVFRDCGVWSVERLTDTSAALRACQLPPVLSATPSWLDSVAGALHAMFHLCRTSGETEVTELDPGQGTARIELRWKPVLE